jgi:hypothetical protein
MANIAGIRNQIQTLLDNVDGLRPYDVATGHERLPCAIVFPKKLEAITVSKYRYEFMIEAYVSLKQGLARAQDELDGFIDPTATTSIEVAIEADVTLGGTVDSTRVDGFITYRFAELNGNTGRPNALVAQIPLEVMA